MGRLALSLACVVGACMAVTATMGFGCLSLYFYMTTVTTPAWAALSVAVFALVVALLLVVVVSLIRRPSLLSLLAREYDPLARLSDAMDAGRNLGDEGREFLKSNLSGASMAAFGFGIAMGISPKLRKAVFRILRS